MSIEEIVEQSRASIEKKDLEFLLRLLVPRNIKNVCEIGTWKGYSAEVWIKAFRPRKLLSIEKGKKEELWDGLEDPRETQAVYVWEVDSHEESCLRNAMRFFSTQEIDMLFIDADHSYEGVKKDFEMYFPLVRKGGIIVFHDALYHADGTEEVDIFWDEIKNSYNYMEFKLSENSTGMGVIFK